MYLSIYSTLINIKSHIFFIFFLFPEKKNVGHLFLVKHNFKPYSKLQRVRYSYSHATGFSIIPYIEANCYGAMGAGGWDLSFTVYGQTMMTAAASRTVLITGVSKGIGRALAVELAKRGHTVIGCARTQDKLTSLRSELTNSDNHLFLNVDVVSSLTVSP